jgi:hypothetical protein
MNIFHVLPLSLVKVLQTNKYISHFAKLNSEVLLKIWKYYMLYYLFINEYIATTYIKRKS